MVLGILGIFLCMFYGVASIIAVVFGHVALSQIKRTGQEGRGMAIAGLATGYTGIALGLVFIVVAIATSSGT